MGAGSNPKSTALSSLRSLLTNEDFSNPMWRKISSELESRNPTCSKKMSIMRIDSRGTLAMKRRVRYEHPSVRTRTRTRGVERKVRSLKKLIPNCESIGVDRLFMEAADYVLALQMRVRVMQMVVEMLSGGDE